MKYFDRVRIPNRGKVWSLFSDINKVDSKIPVESLDIINTARRGNITLDRSFNLRGYASKSLQNKNISSKEKEHEVPLLLDYIDDGDKPSSCYGVTEEQLPTSHWVYEDPFEEFDKEAILNEIQRITLELKEEGLCLRTCIDHALLGVDSAKKMLKWFLTEYPYYQEEVLGYLKVISEGDSYVLP